MVKDRLPNVEADVAGQRVTLRFDTGAFDAGIALLLEDMMRMRIEPTEKSRVADAYGNEFEVGAFWSARSQDRQPGLEKRSWKRNGLYP